MKKTFKKGIANEGFVSDFLLSKPEVVNVFNSDSKSDGRNHDWIRVKLNPLETGEERIVMMSDDQMAYLDDKFNCLVEVEKGQFTFKDGWAIECSNYVLSAEEVDAE